MLIKGLTRKELDECLQRFALPRYRVDQIWSWLYHKAAVSWDEMTNLPLALREELAAAGLTLSGLEVADKVTASDGTVKYLFRLEDGAAIESVFLPETHRNTVCLSTQVGCGMGCAFCATGQNGLTRNLSAGEIIDQPLYIGRLQRTHLSNLVMMGQGEPFSNYDAVLKAVRLMNDPAGMGMGARHITISTCGVAPGIRKLANEPYQVNLAVSLHAVNDELRSRLMPINRIYPLAELLESCRYYVAKTNRRITFEYTMIGGVNDGPADLKGLLAALRGMLCHVNLIPLNPVPGSEWERSSMTRIDEFEAALNRGGIETTVRKERGSSLSAACGQLQGKRGHDLKK